MKKQIAITTTAVFLVLSITGFAQAGSRHGHHHYKKSRPHHSRQAHHHHNHALEGVMIGAGALLLGTAIAQSINTTPAPAPPVHMVPVPPAPCVKKQGHWETRRVWVPPVYETRWNPAHYDAAGNWIQGRYENFLTANGYWEQTQVWVSCASVF